MWEEKSEAGVGQVHAMTPSPYSWWKGCGMGDRWGCDILTWGPRLEGRGWLSNQAGFQEEWNDHLSNSDTWLWFLSAKNQLVQSNKLQVQLLEVGNKGYLGDLGWGLLSRGGRDLGKPRVLGIVFNRLPQCFCAMWGQIGIRQRTLLDTQLEKKQQPKLIIELPGVQAQWLWKPWWVTQTPREDVIITPHASSFSLPPWLAEMAVISIPGSSDTAERAEVDPWPRCTSAPALAGRLSPYLLITFSKSEKSHQLAFITPLLCSRYFASHISIYLPQSNVELFLKNTSILSINKWRFWEKKKKKQQRLHHVTQNCNWNRVLFDSETGTLVLSALLFLGWMFWIMSVLG